MKSLICVPVVHDFPDWIYRVVSDDSRRHFDTIRKILPGYFRCITRGLINFSKANPVHKVYVEDYNTTHSEGHVLESNYMMHMPVKALVRQGAILMSTEHPVFHFLIGVGCGLMRQKGRPALGVWNKLSKKPCLEVLSQLEDIISGLSLDWYNDLCSLCEGEKYFDIGRLRDKYIASNIRQTLRENERGVLVIGEKHKVGNVILEMGTDIAVASFRTK